VKTELAANGLRVSIDHDQCSGTGYCQDAAAACPWFAITVEEQ
jgi:ferredoxin